MRQQQNTVIIVKKKRGHGHGHHGGAWKVAYADFVTAMMAFFLVMWIVGQSAQTKAAVAQYFRDPGVFDHGRGGILEGTNGTPQQVPAPSDDSGKAALMAAESQLKSAL